jgi:hypothetical protein
VLNSLNLSSLCVLPCGKPLRVYATAVATTGNPPIALQPFGHPTAGVSPSLRDATRREKTAVAPLLYETLRVGKASRREGRSSDGRKPLLKSPVRIAQLSRVRVPLQYKQATRSGRTRASETDPQTSLCNALPLLCGSLHLHTELVLPLFSH